LIELLTFNLNKSKVSSGSLLASAYRRDTVLNDQFMETKDFFYNMGKCLSGALSQCVLAKKQLREPLFKVFYEFLEVEYYPLHR